MYRRSTKQINIMDIDVFLIRKDKTYMREVAPGDYQDKLRFV